MTPTRLQAALALAALAAAPALAQSPALHPPDPDAALLGADSLGGVLREELDRPARMHSDAGEWFDAGRASYRTLTGAWRPAAIRVDLDGVGVWSRNGRQPVMFLGDRAHVHHEVVRRRPLRPWRWAAVAIGFAAAGAHHLFAADPSALTTAGLAGSGVGVSLGLAGLAGGERYRARLQGERGRGILLRVSPGDRSRFVWSLDQFQRRNERAWRARHAPAGR